MRPLVKGDLAWYTPIFGARRAVVIDAVLTKDGRVVYCCDESWGYADQFELRDYSPERLSDLEHLHIWGR